MFLRVTYSVSRKSKTSTVPKMLALVQRLRDYKDRCIGQVGRVFFVMNLPLLRAFCVKCASKNAVLLILAFIRLFLGVITAVENVVPGSKNACAYK